MTSSAIVRSVRLCFTAAAIAGFAWTLSLAWMPVPDAVSHFVVEDMGYYLTTARNIVTGHGVTLDGENPTNGFHPLWLVILACEAWLFGANEEWLFHIALTTCVILFGATCWILARDVRDRMRAPLGAPIAALLLCNFRLASNPLGGLETALAGLATIATISFLAWCPNDLTLRKAVSLGGLLGLACLSRMDALLFSGIVIAWTGYRSLRVSRVRALAIVVVSSGSMLACLIPWFVYSRGVVHAWLPRSGEAILFFSPSPWSHPWTAERLHNAFRDTVIGPLGDVANVVGLWPLVNAGRVTHLSGAGALAAAAAVLAVMTWRVRQDALVERLLWIPFYAVVIALYYCQFRSNHLRYLYPAILSVVYLSAAVVAAWVRGRRGGPVFMWWLYACVAVMMTLASIAGMTAYRLNVGTSVSHLGGRALLNDLAQWLADRTEPTARVGSFNGGLVSYFSGRTVVNLDGVMNDNAIAALRSGTLCEYADAQQLGYLADNRLAIEFFLDADPSCRRVNWRLQWQVVHDVRRRIDATGDIQEFVVMRKQ